MNDILWRIEAGVYPTTPRDLSTTDLRYLEVEGFPIGVRDQMKSEFFVGQLYCERDAVRRFLPIGLANLDPMPSQIRPAEELIQAYTPALDLRLSQTAASAEQRDEPVHICMLREEPPIEPAGFIILTIGIVVSELRSPRLIAHENHRYTRRKHCNRQKIFDLAVSELFHSWIFAGTFITAIPASVIIHSIAIAFPVRFVVFAAVGDEVV
jgi:hypothetical protein